ncbi:MAG: hypothetical protein LC750_11825, partial [Actinobacteria bacterium]|nr:hypothetical protein [Actinomycetota bacterium]
MRHSKRTKIRGSRILFLAITVVVVFAAMSFAASAAEAATCQSGSVNLNLGTGCANVLGVPVLESSSGGSACTEPSGCNTVKTETPEAPATPTITPSQPAAKRTQPHHTYVRKSVVPAVPTPAPHRVNRADQDSGFYYSGTYNRSLPYP